MGLCLTRKSGDSVVVFDSAGRRLVIELEKVGSNTRLHFSGPREFVVLRGEMPAARIGADPVSPDLA